MTINKVIYNGMTLVDLTSDTIMADVLQSGYTAHQADGEQITGSAVPASNPNLLDNWYFIDPINQREGLLVVSGQNYYNTASTANGLGQLDNHYKVDTVLGDWVIFSMNGTQYYARKQFCENGYKTDTSGYCIDRWHSGRTEIILSSAGLSLAWSGATLANGIAYGFFQQYIEGKELCEKVVTLSAIIDGKLYSLTETVPVSKNKTIKVSPDLNFVFVVSTNHVGIMIQTLTRDPKILTAIKLELSTHQTLAHKEGDVWILNDPPPNKALELQKCQRYFWKMSGAWIPAGIAVSVGTNQAHTQISYPVPLRTSPSIKFNKLYLNGINAHGENAISVTGLTLGRSVNGRALIVVNSSASLTVGASYMITGRNDSDSYLEFSAEL